MTDWIEHDAGPQPVADDVWVAIRDTYDGPANETNCDGPANEINWVGWLEYRILNQHLIDAARLEGIRLGLEAAAREIMERVDLSLNTQGGDEWLRPDHMRADIRALDPATIAKETAR